MLNNPIQIINAEHAIWPRITDRGGRHVSPEVTSRLAHGHISLQKNLLLLGMAVPREAGQGARGRSVDRHDSPPPAPGQTVGLSRSQVARVPSCAPLIREPHVVRLWMIQINKMRASTQRKIQAESSHTALSSMWKRDEVFAASAVSRWNWIAFVRTSNSYPCLVGSCPLQRKMKPAGSGRTKTATKVSKALHSSEWRSVCFLERASSNKVMYRELCSRQVKTCCFRSEIQHGFYSSKDRQDL